MGGSFFKEINESASPLAAEEIVATARTAVPVTIAGESDAAPGARRVRPSVCDRARSGPSHPEFAWTARPCSAAASGGIGNAEECFDRFASSCRPIAMPAYGPRTPTASTRRLSPATSRARLTPRSRLATKRSKKARADMTCRIRSRMAHSACAGSRRAMTKAPSAPAIVSARRPYKARARRGGTSFRRGSATRYEAARRHPSRQGAVKTSPSDGSQPARYDFARW